MENLLEWSGPAAVMRTAGSGFFSMQHSKPRSDSVLDRMPAADRERLDEWLLENKSYAEVRDLVAAELGVTTSASALGRYYARWIVPLRFVMATKLAEATCSGPEVDYEGAVKKVAELQMFEALAGPAPDVRRAKWLGQILSGLHRTKYAKLRVDLQERRVAVQERLAKLKEPVPEPPRVIDFEQKAREMRELFGLPPKPDEEPAWMVELKKKRAASATPVEQVQPLVEKTENEKVKGDQVVAKATAGEAETEIASKSGEVVDGVALENAAEWEVAEMNDRAGAVPATREMAGADACATGEFSSIHHVSPAKIA